MRSAIFLLLISVLIGSGCAESDCCSESKSPGTISDAKDATGCLCKMDQLIYSEAYITKFGPCDCGNCPGFWGMYTPEEGPVYQWALPGALEAKSPLRIVLFDVINGSKANYTIGLKNLGTFDLTSTSLEVILPNMLTVDSSTQPFSQSGNKVTWRIFTLKPGESRDIRFSTNLHNNKSLTNLTAEASGVGEDDMLYKSKWDSGVYEIKGDAVWQFIEGVRLVTDDT